MDWFLLGIQLTGAYPLWRFWRANRNSSLLHVIYWTFLAWLAWAMLLVERAFRSDEDNAVEIYMALCLTGCAGIAVLGARRPLAGPWNFVVVGLLAVLLLPLAEGWGDLNLSAGRIFFLAATLSVIGFNYGLTRLGPASVFLLAGCAILMVVTLKMAGFHNSRDSFVAEWGFGVITISPWIALTVMCRKAKLRDDLDKAWLSFRDRYGMVWALRIADQFNRSAANSGWPFRLTWAGVKGSTAGYDKSALHTWEELIKRFGAAGSDESELH
ncbi:MAG: hypothetical protein ACJ8FY_20120 [Gemmataceae bacterium]